MEMVGAGGNGLLDPARSSTRLWRPVLRFELSPSNSATVTVRLGPGGLFPTVNDLHHGPSMCPAATQAKEIVPIPLHSAYLNVHRSRRTTFAQVVVRFSPSEQQASDVLPNHAPFTLYRVPVVVVKPANAANFTVLFLSLFLFFVLSTVFVSLLVVPLCGMIMGTFSWGGFAL